MGSFFYLLSVHGLGRMPGTTNKGRTPICAIAEHETNGYHTVTSCGSSVALRRDSSATLIIC